MLKRLGTTALFQTPLWLHLPLKKTSEIPVATLSLALQQTMPSALILTISRLPLLHSLISLEYERERQVTGEQT